MSRIPLVSLQDVEHFYVVGSQHRDGILGEYNLKTDLKAALYPSKDSSGPNANGHEYVDLGLPSGTLWATMNVGATKPEEYGDYYAWGEIVPNKATAYTFENYKFGTTDALTKYNDTDNKTALDLEDDAVHVVMGGDWHMPSMAQLNELTANATSSWTTDYNGTGVAGAVFTSNINGNSIFFPAAGVLDDAGAIAQGESFGIWSSSRQSSPSNAAYLNGDTNYRLIYGNSRYSGFTVRGVLGELNASPEDDDIFR